MSTQSSFEELPIVVGAVAGLAAWILGYLSTYVLVGTDVERSALNRIVEFFDGGSATYELVGWVFYNAHLVDVSYSGLGPFAPPASFIGGEDGFTILLYVVPPALLVAAGIAIARYQGVTGTNEGALTGALVVPGYLVLSVVGVFLFEVSVGNATGAPDLLPAVVLAGVVYPLVFGAVGGVIAANTSDVRPAEGSTGDPQ